MPHFDKRVELTPRRGLARAFSRSVVMGPRCSKGLQRVCEYTCEEGKIDWELIERFLIFSPVNSMIIAFMDGGEAEC